MALFLSVCFHGDSCIRHSVENVSVFKREQTLSTLMFYTAEHKTISSDRQNTVNMKSDGSHYAPRVIII